jgi:hypothetical protein
MRSLPDAFKRSVRHAPAPLRGARWSVDAGISVHGRRSAGSASSRTSVPEQSEPRRSPFP